MAGKELLIPAERIEKAILLIRGQKVMLDRDLAELYGVTTFNLNKAVKRNRDRFPEDFMFQLTKEEAEILRFQTGISKPAGSGGRRIFLTSSPNRAWPCFPASCGASGPCR